MSNRKFEPGALKESEPARPQIHQQASNMKHC